MNQTRGVWVQRVKQSERARVSNMKETKKKRSPYEVWQEHPLDVPLIDPILHPFAIATCSLPSAGVHVRLEYVTVHFRTQYIDDRPSLGAVKETED